MVLVEAWVALIVLLGIVCVSALLRAGGFEIAWLGFGVLMITVNFLPEPPGW